MGKSNAARGRAARATTGTRFRTRAPRQARPRRSRSAVGNYLGKESALPCALSSHVGEKSTCRTGHSRKVVGWALDRTLAVRLTIRALEQAIERQQPEPGLVHHSDRGFQYARAEYIGVHPTNFSPTSVQNGPFGFS